jgi:hypothetical protein
MHIDPYIVLGSAIIGFLVGMTGAGGGALMTPMLILLFGVKPAAAISSDLVAAVTMRPFGAAVHLRKGTPNLSLVKWLVIGSVPAAFAGAYILHLIGGSKAAQTNIETVLGAIAFGHVEFGVTVSLILGSVPAVLIGSTFSSTAPDRYVRPVITFVITASGLKYIGLDTETLGWTLCGILGAIAVWWVVSRRPWETAAWGSSPTREEPAAAVPLAAVSAEEVVATGAAELPARSDFE